MQQPARILSSACAEIIAESGNLLMSFRPGSESRALGPACAAIDLRGHPLPTCLYLASLPYARHRLSLGRLEAPSPAF